MNLRTYNHTCQLPQCGKKFVSGSPKSKFCSDACKVRNHRIQHGSAPDRHQGNTNGAQTKAQQVITLICEHCGKEFTRDGNAAGNSLYCSDAHKAAAYRERRGYLLSRAMEFSLKDLLRRRGAWISPRTAAALIDRGLIKADEQNRWAYQLTEKGQEIAQDIAFKHEHRLLEGKGTPVK